MRRQLRPEDNLPEVIVRAVADETERDPMELSPLGECIDPDAIHSLFTRSSGDESVRLKLLYEGCRVTVEPDAVTVEHITEA